MTGKEMHITRRQSGRVKNMAMDKMLPAMYPGQRLSINNKIYWETRKNRSDLNKMSRL